MQNHDRWDGYLAAIEGGGLATRRALATTERERLTRELILQLKRGWLERSAFERKFGVDVVERYAGAFGSLTEQGLATVGPERVDLSDGGLLRVDQLLPPVLRRALPGRPLHLSRTRAGAPAFPDAGLAPDQKSMPNWIPTLGGRRPDGERAGVVHEELAEPVLLVAEVGGRRRPGTGVPAPRSTATGRGTGRRKAGRTAPKASKATSSEY